MILLYPDSCTKKLRLKKKAAAASLAASRPLQPQPTTPLAVLPSALPPVLVLELVPLLPVAVLPPALPPVLVQSAKFQAHENLRELRAAALLKCKSRCSGLGMCKGFSFYYSSAIHGYACSPKSSVCADKPLKCDLLGFCFYIRKPQQYLQVCNCKKEKKSLYMYSPAISIQC